MFGSCNLKMRQFEDLKIGSFLSPNYLIFKLKLSTNRRQFRLLFLRCFSRFCSRFKSFVYNMQLLCGMLFGKTGSRAAAFGARNYRQVYQFIVMKLTAYI